MAPALWLVVPCYNEEEILPYTTGELTKKMTDLMTCGVVSNDSRILYVDDGSRDQTWQMIAEQAERDSLTVGIRLAHNRGHQNALLAGLQYACGKCDCTITLDADLQDDINVIEKFVQKYQEGCQIVYGVRRKRDTDTWFKRTSAQMFYRFMSLMGAETVYNHADYRLMSRKAMEALEGYGESTMFLRGVIPQIGMQSDVVCYDRKERLAGETKYPFRKMVAFALEGITSFSVRPLRLIAFLGMLCSVLSVGGLIYALVSYFCHAAVPGWTAVVCSIWLLGGIQLLCLGVVGEYVGKIFSEVKHRPRFYIDEITGDR